MLSEVWNGSTGPVWLAQAQPGNVQHPGFAGHNGGNPLISGADLTTIQNYGGFQGGGVPTPIHDVVYAANPAKGYKNFNQQMLAINQIWGGGGWVPLADRSGATGPFLPNEINQTGEKTDAGYALLKFGSDEVVSGNVGVRYVNTSDTSAGFVGFPTSVGASLSPVPSPPGTPAPTTANCVVGPGGGAPPAICTLTPAEQAAEIAFCNPQPSGAPVGGGVQNYTCAGGSSTLHDKNRFSYWLPSLNVKIKLTDDMQLRFAANESITRPDMGLLRDFICDNDARPQGIPGFTAQSGNPFLKPVKGDNYDLSY